MNYKVIKDGLHYTDGESTPIPVGTVLTQNQIDYQTKMGGVCKFGNCPMISDDVLDCINGCLLPSGCLEKKEG